MTALEREAKEKWGQTQAYREYEEKHASKQAKDELTEGLEDIMASFACCMKNGESADSDQSQLLVKTLQNYITEHCYKCTNEILASLGQMYVADERFKNNIDKHAAGAAAFIREAITAYCRK